MVRERSPGPAIVMLPSTVGYNKHDTTKYRNPMYTMRPAFDAVGAKNRVPGPQYQVQGINQHGKFSSPAYSIKSRTKPFTVTATPGPGAHSPEKVNRMKEPRPPAYTMGARLKFGSRNIGPGPAYCLPSTLGPKVPNKQASSAYTMGGRQDVRIPPRSPGPAVYGAINQDCYKNAPPKYSMSIRVLSVGKNVSPGPAAYLPKKLCGEYGLSYTMRPPANDVVTPYITPEDMMPCT